MTDIDTLVSRLQENKLIESQITLITGQQKNIRGISFWDFQNETPQSKLVSGSSLSILDTTSIASLDPGQNYAFKVHITKTNGVFAGLEVFSSTDRKDFPLFIIYISDPISFTLYRQDEEDEDENLLSTKVQNINCIITSSGNDMESLLELGEEPEKYALFYNQIKSTLGELEIGSYIE
ncbi:hypothetical protein [Xanthocytophaga agilis]|uniref:Uncharacterized protein n=1 Tax=Xanthocytophaga agilis TaxID=3048010 RepID=A0AAE3UBU0_9BACT|nr:hypothetical protein [Xanthocytophaga agilis]MDJ1500188.1 hypothetical protein [Xanthocytophaga agilis]